MPDRNSTAFSLRALEQALDELLYPVLSSQRNLTKLAEELLLYSHAQQEFVLHWIGIVAKTNTELAYQFATHAPQALAHMCLESLEEWIIQAMDIYDKMGLYPASNVFQAVEKHAAQARHQADRLGFEDVARVLGLFVHGLCGRRLKLAASEEIYTDTRTLFLPPELAQLPGRENNFRLYKAMVVHQWAQTWYGTFQVNLAAAMQEFPDPSKALQLFHALERVRLEACVARDFPGLYRELQSLNLALGEPAWPSSWQTPLQKLRRSNASAETSWEAVKELYDTPMPTPIAYQGGLYPARVAEGRALRRAEEKKQFRQALQQLVAKQDQQRPKTDPQLKKIQERIKIKTATPVPGTHANDLELNVDGHVLQPPGQLQGLMQSILQDLGEIPEDYLTDGPQGPDLVDRPDHSGREILDTDSSEDTPTLYPEWDYRRRHYRKQWCELREIDVYPVQDDFVTDTRHKYRNLIQQLRKSFELLRGDEQLLKKQKHGDDIDFDALVEAYADMAHGEELNERIMTKLRKHKREIAVMFMVDMSGSTKGWINDAEREALVLLCEALEVLGDRYAIYGFSGITRKRCELYRVKRFDEAYDNAVRARISGIKPQDYTRMGVSIRHLTQLLKAVQARTKLLITLSDGKPDDYDGYRGDYGIEDTRQALVEAKHEGIHPFCITIDSQAKDYLPHMYGSVNYILIDDVRKLPLRVTDIYRRLTT